MSEERASLLNEDMVLNPGNSSELTLQSIVHQLKFFFTQSYLNFFLVFVPLGIVASHAGWSDTTVFTLNFFAIIPLANLLGLATEEVSSHLGQTIGGLVNATFGNAVELIVSILALNHNLIRVVQASLLGSILSNLLLVLGLCFFAGGCKYSEQSFNVTAAQTNSSLLGIVVLSLLVPAAFNNVVGDKELIKSGIINLSHGTAIILLIVYISYLLFQLKTHNHLFEGESDEHEHEEATMSLPIAIFCLFAITLVVSFSAESLVGSIEGLTKQLGLSETFVGIILVPIVGNAAEHMTAVTVAMKNKMDLSLAVALGSSMQIALFVTPVLVLIGWITDKQMTLFFDTFETAVLFISVLIVNYLIQDGKSNWLEGLTLLAAYFVIALAFFFYPQTIENVL